LIKLRQLTNQYISSRQVTLEDTVVSQFFEKTCPPNRLMSTNKSTHRNPCLSD